MSFLSNPKILYAARIAQLVLGILFLVLICYDGTHRSWWRNINGPLAVGVITSIFTFAISIYSMYVQTLSTHSPPKAPHLFITHRSNPFSGGTLTITIARIAAEVLVFFLWVASAALMLRPRGGCENKHKPTEGTDLNSQYCWNDAWKNGKKYDDQPIKTWDVGIAVALIEAVSFIATVVMVWLDDRKSKVSGGTSYA
ncbi:MAG: hypothetical protein Q9170_004732 [Blastenia crenularia]